MSVYDKETDFVDNYTVDKTSRIDYTKPNKILKVNFPFSSFGFNLGFRFAYKLNYFCLYIIKELDFVNQALFS